MTNVTMLRIMGGKWRPAFAKRMPQAEFISLNIKPQPCVYQIGSPSRSVDKSGIYPLVPANGYLQYWAARVPRGRSRVRAPQNEGVFFFLKKERSGWRGE